VATSYERRTSRPTRSTGCDVVVHDVRPEATAGIGVPVFSTLDELLGDRRVEVVDIATHPAARPELRRDARGK
jgi:predicted dehydrogenase